MKKTTCSLAVCCFFATAGAQTTKQNSGSNNTAWTPNSKICDPYKANQNAQNSMSPAVKAFNNASQSKAEKNVNAITNAYCNPPVKTGSAKKAN
jgi:hypothetical protein